MDPNGINLISLAWLAVCWMGYTQLAKIRARTSKCIAATLHVQRRRWMESMLERDMRIAGTALLASLERNVTFFASTTILILAGLLTDQLSDIPPEVLYEDDAPHGQPTLYFLAGLITYMATYGVEAPASYPIPSDIDPDVASRYAELVDAIWLALLPSAQSFLRSSTRSSFQVALVSVMPPPRGLAVLIGIPLRRGRSLTTAQNAREDWEIRRIR